MPEQSPSQLINDWQTATKNKNAKTLSKVSTGFTRRLLTTAAAGLPTRQCLPNKIQQRPGQHPFQTRQCKEITTSHESVRRHGS